MTLRPFNFCNFLFTLVISYLSIISPFKANVVTDPTKHTLCIFHTFTRPYFSQLCYNSCCTQPYLISEVITDTANWPDSRKTGVLGSAGEPALIMPNYRTASPWLPKLQPIASSHHEKQNKKQTKPTKPHTQKTPVL